MLLPEDDHASPKLRMQRSIKENQSKSRIIIILIKKKINLNLQQFF